MPKKSKPRSVKQILKKHSKIIDETTIKFPEISELLYDLVNVLKSQQKQLNQIKKQLKRHNEPAECVSVNCQSNAASSPLAVDNVVEDITKAAQDAVSQSGMVYEETSGLYYDYKTGYYYNAEYGLYYDGNSGTYLKYNTETKKLEFYSQVNVTQNPTSAETAKSGNELKRKRDRIAANIEEGELSESDSDDEERNQKDALKPTKKERKEVKFNDIVGSPSLITPCIRFIVSESQLKNLTVGTLFIVTCDGGTIGREGDHHVLIPEILASKHHAKVTYDECSKKYQIVDLGSRNGTFLNGKRLSVAKQESEPREIEHSTILQIGSVKLLCHIHEGTDTCDECEPGVVMKHVAVDVPQKSTQPLSSQYRDELKRLRKKFAPVPEEIKPSKGYKDRAEIRRKTVGGFNHAEKTETASLDESIRQENKGFKLLEKMGWKTGDALGKDNQGLKEPIPLVGNEGTMGLGSSSMM